jgi:hypothetical protein
VQVSGRAAYLTVMKARFIYLCPRCGQFVEYHVLAILSLIIKAHQPSLFEGRKVLAAAQTSMHMQYTRHSTSWNTLLMAEKTQGAGQC